MNPDPLGPSTASGPYDLVPDYSPGAVSLPRALAIVGTNAAPGSATTLFFKIVEETTGLLPPAGKAPSPAHVLTITTGQLKDIINAAHLAHQKMGFPKEAPPREKLLPVKFDLATLEALTLPRPELKMTPLRGSLFLGEMASTTPDERIKRNRVMAEVLHRLAENLNTKPGEQPFEVTLNGKAHTSSDSFLEGLKAAGYAVSVRFDTRVADFLPLRLKAGERFAPVPTPLMIQTGIKDSRGNEAVVPATHSEVMIFIKPEAGAHGPNLDSAIRFFQSTAGVGFWAGEMIQHSAWAGLTSSQVYDGGHTVKAIRAAAGYAAAMLAIAKEKNLLFDRPGVAICNDSIAVVEHAVSGKTNQYPLLMNRDLLLDEFRKRGTSDPRWATLAKATQQLPSDVPTGQANLKAKREAHESTARRAMASCPWKEGSEPFYSSIEARRILRLKDQ